jgi:hypothetical protein
MVAIITASIFTIGFFILGIITEIEPHELNIGILLDIIFLFIFSLIGNLVYGLPVSFFFSDLISKNLKKTRFILSTIIHIGSGLIAMIVLGDFLGIPALICSVIFLVTDEISRRMY